jgi:hypothetical protein
MSMPFRKARQALPTSKFWQVSARPRLPCHDRGRARFEVIAADRGVDQDADLLVRHAGFRDRLLRGQRGGVGGHGVGAEHAALVNAGDVLEQVVADAQPVERRLQTLHDLGRGQADRRLDMGDAGDGDVLVEHERFHDRKNGRAG